MRLIDADKIKKFIENGLNSKDPQKRFGHDAIEIMTEIHYSEAVDAVPVVRCKDCIHYRLFYRSQPFMYYYQCGREGATRSVDEDDFCKYGERPLQ